jgi:hypothetical protein
MKRVWGGGLAKKGFQQFGDAGGIHALQAIQFLLLALRLGTEH